MSTTQQSVTKFLVVCGAKSASDSWLFGNFLGFCRALKILGVEGDFWSCFPIREFFEGHHNSISFGRRGTGQSPEDQEALEIFTKADFYSGKRFWDQVSWERAEQLSGDVLSYTESQAKKLEAGDIFNIILIGHGTEEGTSLGGEILQAKDLAKALDNFRPKVRVNVVVQSCHSGVFMDKISAKNQRQRFVHTSSSSNELSWTAQISPSERFRNSVFSGAFLRSLGLAVSPETTDWTLEGHINFLKREGRGEPGTKANPQHYTSDIVLITKFVDVLFTDFVDRSFSQTTTATNVARRILTPSAPLTGPSNPPSNIPWQHVQNASKCITAELGFAGNSAGEKDAALIQAATSSNYLFENKKISAELYQQRQAELIRALGWRFRIQEYFYLAMEGLANKDLVDFDLAFRYPMCWGVKADSRVPIIVKLLKSLEVVHECCAPDPGDMLGRFDSVVYWLATIIVRSCSDLRRTMSYLMTTGLLGKVNIEYLKTIEHENITIGKPPQPPTTKELLPQIGFWLPQSSNMSVGGCTWGGVGRYYRVKANFEQFFGQGSWGISDFIENSLMFTSTSYHYRAVS